MKRPIGRGSDPGELKDLMQRAAALLSGVFMMLGLLVSSAFSQPMKQAMISISQPSQLLPEVTAAPSALPKTTPDPTLSIRLTNVDKDVGADVIVKLIGIEKSTEPVPLSGDEPTVLIYHTHDTEAYRQTTDDEYETSGKDRTEDNDHNVYAVGEELKRILREEYGIIAIHADEKHEKPLITTAYSRSLETMRRYKQMYPSLEMFIDLHRDGVADTGYEDDFVVVDGLECARMMFVVGTGKSGKSSQTSPDEIPDTVHDMPDFESNYALAMRLTETLLSYNGRFMRNICVKSGKYNQQVSDKCLLIEVGHNANTLRQAKNSMIYLAKAISELGSGG